jgi:hypothetical protein
VGSVPGWTTGAVVGVAALPVERLMAAPAMVVTSTAPGVIGPVAMAPVAGPRGPPRR